MALNIKFGYWAIGGCITNVLTPNAGAKAQSHFNLIPGLKAGAPTLRRKRREGTLLMQGSIKGLGNCTDLQACLFVFDLSLGLGLREEHANQFDEPGNHTEHKASNVDPRGMQPAINQHT